MHLQRKIWLGKIANESAINGQVRPGGVWFCIGRGGPHQARLILQAAPAAESAADAGGQLAAKAAAKAGAKAAADAQKAAAKKAAKKRRALATAPNRRLGLFQPFTMHPRRKRSDSVKRCNEPFMRPAHAKPPGLASALTRMHVIFPWASVYITHDSAGWRKGPNANIYGLGVVWKPLQVLLD